MLMLQTLLTTRFQMSMKTDERGVSGVFARGDIEGVETGGQPDAPANSVSGGTYQIIAPAPAVPMSDLAKRLSFSGRSRGDRCDRVGG